MRGRDSLEVRRCCRMERLGLERSVLQTYMKTACALEQVAENGSEFGAKLGQIVSACLEICRGLEVNEQRYQILELTGHVLTLGKYGGVHFLDRQKAISSVKKKTRFWFYTFSAIWYWLTCCVLVG